jgi:flagellar biosynthetic protein FlhB
LRELAARGTTARSHDLATALTLLVGIVAIQQVAPSIVTDGVAGIRSYLQNAAGVDRGTANVVDFWTPMTSGMLTAGAGVLVPVAVVAIAVGLFQVQGRIAFRIISPDPGRLNPIAGFGRLFSWEAAINLLWALLKIVVVSAAVYGPIRATLDSFPTTVGSGIQPQLATLGAALGGAARNAAAALVGLALLDVAYRRWRFQQRARMSRREVQEELRQTEGDPKLRGRLRAQQRRLARQRMLHRVPVAKVVVVNPTHFAVALAYETGKMAAPEVVAKGADLVAQRIMEIARANRVPIVPNAPLARVLYRSVEIGDPIPPALYGAIAEILAHVYALRPRS